MKHAEELRTQLKEQSFEDFYSEYFAGKPIAEYRNLLNDVFKDIYPRIDESFDDLKRRASDWLLMLVEYVSYEGYWKLDEEIQEIDITYLPTFVEFYFSIHYEQNGLKSYVGFVGIFGTYEKYDKKHDLYLPTLYQFEQELLKKDWISEQDKILIDQLYAKRKTVVLFESQLFNFKKEIARAWKAIEIKNGNLDIFQKEFLIPIYEKYLNQINLQIAEINITDPASPKIEVLSRCKDFFNLSKDPTQPINLINKMEQLKVIQEQQIHVDYPINLKVAFLYKSSLYEKIKELLNKSGPVSNAELANLISFIIGHDKPSTIESLFRFLNPMSEQKPDTNKNNPWVSDKLKIDLEALLTKYKLSTLK